MSYLYVDHIFNKIEKKYFTGYNPFFGKFTSWHWPDSNLQSRACDAMYALRCALNELDPMFIPEIEETLEAISTSEGKLDVIKLKLKFEINPVFALLMEVWIRNTGSVSINFIINSKSKAKPIECTVTTEHLTSINVVLRQQEWKKLEDFFHKVVQQGEVV